MGSFPCKTSRRLAPFLISYTKIRLPRTYCNGIKILQALIKNSTDAIKDSRVLDYANVVKILFFSFNSNTPLKRSMGKMLIMYLLNASGRLVPFSTEN